MKTKNITSIVKKVMSVMQIKLDFKYVYILIIFSLIGVILYDQLLLAQQAQQIMQFNLRVEALEKNIQQINSLLIEAQKNKISGNSSGQTVPFLSDGLKRDILKYVAVGVGIAITAAVLYYTGWGYYISMHIANTSSWFITTDFSTVRETGTYLDLVSPAIPDIDETSTEIQSEATENTISTYGASFSQFLEQHWVDRLTKEQLELALAELITNVPPDSIIFNQDVLSMLEKAVS